jgi:hypothetical protein
MAVTVVARNMIEVVVQSGRVCWHSRNGSRAIICDDNVAVNFITFQHKQFLFCQL